MNPLWRLFLATRGASLDETGRTGPPGTRGESRSKSAAIADLSHLSAIELTGADAAAFLHGQLTSDVAGLGQDRAQISAWCNAKGRVIAIVLLLRLRDRYLLLLPQEQCAAFTKRLRIYVLHADVRISDRTDECVRVGVMAGVGHDLPAAGGIAAPVPWEIVEQDGTLFLRLPDTDRTRRLLVCGELAPMQALWPRLETEFEHVTAKGWQLHDILAGIPWLGPALSEEFLPQELGLETLGGLSLAKGCYPGQEIIARVHFRGRPKRGLCHFTVEADTPPAPATPIYMAGKEPRVVGSVIGAETVAGGLQSGLAVCASEVAADSDLKLATPDGPRISPGKLIK